MPVALENLLQEKMPLAVSSLGRGLFDSALLLARRLSLVAVWLV
jgi:hypothetical protein